jgi:hypothetical protein
LYKAGKYDEASQMLARATDGQKEDPEATALLTHSRRHEAWLAGEKFPAGRLRYSFNQMTFRQLKAMLVPGGA